MLRHVITRACAQLTPAMVSAQPAFAAATGGVSVKALADLKCVRGFAADAGEDEGKQFGTCKWFNTTKGWGFIAPKDGSADVFVHQTAIHASGFRSLRDGEEVEYYLEQSQDGKLRAVEVSGPGGQYVEGAHSAPRDRRDDEQY